MRPNCSCSCSSLEHGFPVQCLYQDPWRRPSHQQTVATGGAQRLLLTLGAHLDLHVAAHADCPPEPIAVIVSHSQAVLVLSSSVIGVLCR